MSAFHPLRTFAQCPLSSKFSRSRSIAAVLKLPVVSYTNDEHHRLVHPRPKGDRPLFGRKAANRTFVGNATDGVERPRGPSA